MYLLRSDSNLQYPTSNVFFQRFFVCWCECGFFAPSLLARSQNTSSTPPSLQHCFPILHLAPMSEEGRKTAKCKKKIERGRIVEGFTYHLRATFRCPHFLEDFVLYLRIQACLDSGPRSFSPLLALHMVCMTKSHTWYVLKKSLKTPFSFSKDHIYYPVMGLAMCFVGILGCPPLPPSLPPSLASICNAELWNRSWYFGLLYPSILGRRLNGLLSETIFRFPALLPRNR